MLEKLPDAIGHALANHRAGIQKILFNADPMPAGAVRIELTSPAFAPDSELPPRFTADGEGLSPSLRWHGVPPDAATLALIIEDADSPTAEPLVHAIVVDIDRQESGFEEGSFSQPHLTSPERLGRNSYLSVGWLPPDPPPGHGVHRYAFQLFALAPGASLSAIPGRGELAEAIRQRAIGKGCLIGTYQRERVVRIDEGAAEPQGEVAI